MPWSFSSELSWNAYDMRLTYRPFTVKTLSSIEDNPCPQLRTKAGRVDTRYHKVPRHQMCIARLLSEKWLDIWKECTLANWTKDRIWLWAWNPIPHTLFHLWCNQLNYTVGYFVETDIIIYPLRGSLLRLSGCRNWSFLAFLVVGKGAIDCILYEWLLQDNRCIVLL